MMEEEKDVNLAEDTAADSSTDEQTTDTLDESSGEDVKAPNKESESVPRSRLNKEIERRRAAEELAEIYQEALKDNQPKGQGSMPDQKFDTVESWQKFIDESDKRTLSEAEKRAQAIVRQELDRRRLEDQEDLPLYSEAVAAEIKRNPNISMMDAYHLAKAKHPLANKQREAMEAEARKSAEAKQRAQVGRSKTRESKPTLSPEEIFARDPKTGRFKYSQGEIEEMLQGN